MLIGEGAARQRLLEPSFQSKASSKAEGATVHRTVDVATTRLRSVCVESPALAHRTAFSPSVSGCRLPEAGEEGAGALIANYSLALAP
jgi:hypothetical protein